MQSNDKMATTKKFTSELIPEIRSRGEDGQETRSPDAAVAVSSCPASPHPRISASPLKEIIIATGNKHKVEEISAILKDLNIKAVPMISFPSYPKTVEDGKTLEENAAKKAGEAALFFKKWALADDTGLEVDYLNGEPGVYSARYAGELCTYEDNNNKLLDNLKNVPDEKRTAKFRCVIAISSPEGAVSLADGQIFGIISKTAAGVNGFGYDPVFFVPEYNKTFAELSSEIKNKISHRSKALQKAKEILRQLIVNN